MKLKFIIFETRAPEWVQAARAEYAKKLAGFLPFEIQILKSPTAEREQAEVKRRQEAELLLRALDERDLLVLFDEAGRVARSSEEFAARLGRVVESGKARVVFVIGGPFGFADEIKRRAAELWSLSPLTMNHWIAQLMALEQLYRGLTIRKGVPYHNR